VKIPRYLRRQLRLFLQSISPAVADSPDAGGFTVRMTANYADQTSLEIPLTSTDRLTST
jgi:hypothetical protein